MTFRKIDRTAWPRNEVFEHYFSTIPGHREGPGLSFDQRDEKTSGANALGLKTRLAHDIPFSR